MTNNDVLRRVRYLLNYNDNEMVGLAKLGDLECDSEDLSGWLKKDDDPEFIKCRDFVLASFLNGLIIQKRGEKEGQKPKAESKLTNNLILRKLMIAFSLNTNDVIEIMNLADLRISKHELSAFFRRPDHKNYRECKDQILRNFLNGMQLKAKK